MTQPDLLITLTLSAESESSLLIRRGELAHVRQFAYTDTASIAAAIDDALTALAAVEADPPVIPDTPPPAPSAPKKPKAAPTPAAPSEPTIDIPLHKGKKAVKISHLKIVGGETDTAAYNQAVALAGKLIDGKLWDGETPIQFDDVYAVARKMKHLTAHDLSLFTLADFVQFGELATASIST